MESGSVMDVVEIDAASNNGVDNIRELREEAAFTPASARYRVYIIDEVHMLSQGAFNALLKTPGRTSGPCAVYFGHDGGPQIAGNHSLPVPAV